MRVWVNSREAGEIRRWAAEAGWSELADRFYRAERSSDRDMWGTPPFIWRRRARRPVLVQCICCERWEGFRSHRDVKRFGWVMYEGRSVDDEIWPGGWIHDRCIETWEENASWIVPLRHSSRASQNASEFLFGRPELVETYKGVLVRGALPEEHTFGGLLDDEEAIIQSESGMESVVKVIDEMPPAIRANLVAAAYKDFPGGSRDGVLLGWADAVPPEYDRVEFKGIWCYSVVVEEVPKLLRNQLPESLRAKL